MNPAARQNNLAALRVSDDALTEQELAEREEKERADLAWEELDVLMMLFWRWGHEAVKRHLSWIRRIMRSKHERS